MVCLTWDIISLLSPERIRCGIAIVISYYFRYSRRVVSFQQWWKQTIGQLGKDEIKSFGSHWTALIFFYSQWILLLPSVLVLSGRCKVTNCNGERSNLKEKPSRDTDEERIERKKEDFCRHVCVQIGLMCEPVACPTAIHTKKPCKDEILHLLKKRIFMHNSHRRGLMILLPQWT